MSFFCAKGIQKNYDGIQIEFSMQAERNSFTSIVGASGSGKSTVLKIIAGLIPNDGKCSILLGEKEVSDLHPSKRNIGMVFQSPSLFTSMNVEENVAYGLRSRGVPRSKALLQARDFLEEFGLKGMGSRKVETLSGGEAQRVSLARTLIVKPELVLFDEPFSALDAPLRKKLAKDILELQKNHGFTAIMVTHDIAEAKYMAQNIILMEKGSIKWQGDSHSFSENYMDDSSR